MKRIATILLFFGILVMTLGGVAQLSYVYSDSMEPTINRGDGYIIVSANNIEEGTIITFRSDQRNEHVTHRVVRETSDGYITKGDNNDQTDQEAGHPLVTEGQIVGTVLTVGNTPLIIPSLMGTISFLTNYWFVALLVLLIIGSTNPSVPSRDLIVVGDLMNPLFAMLILTATVMVVLNAAVVPVRYTVSDVPSEDPLTIQTNSKETVEVPLSSLSSPYFHSQAASDDVTVTDVSHDEDEMIVTTTIPPQDNPGVIQMSIDVYHYPATLPYRVTSVLHAIHPFLAAFGTIGAATTPLYLLNAFLVDLKAPFKSVRSRRFNSRGKP